MDASSIIWTLLLGLTYGYLIYFFTWYHVHDFLIRLYYGYSRSRFEEFYETRQNGFASYSYFSHAPITNLEYLQAFNAYDVETAYTDYRKDMRRHVTAVYSKRLVLKLSLLFIGYVLFPLPLYGYGLVVGYYVVRLVITFTGQYGLSTATIGFSQQFVEVACRSAYGSERSVALLANQQASSSGATVVAVDTTLLGRLASANRKLWEDKKWIRTLLVWIIALFPLSFVAAAIHIPIITDIIDVFITLYTLFPLSYLIYRLQVLVNDDETNADIPVMIEPTTGS